jgi:type 1 glutamine amidotransferase
MGYLGRQMAVSDCGILDNGELITYKLQIMKHLLILLFTACTLLTYAQVPEGYPANYAKAPRFKALIYYTQHAEEAHVQFAEQATTFFKKLNYGDGFVLDITTDFSKYPYEKLKEYNVIIMLNTSPNTKAERDAFEQYVENGGGWVGFHAAAYNDKNTHWPWFVKFLGGGVFYCNNWPPQPVLVEVDNEEHPVTKNLPASFVAPASEWYQWTPSPRQNKDVEVLLSLSPKNYPLGIKDVVNFGDFPIVWSNKNYRMIYLNMGHGDEEFIDGTQNLLLVNAFRWVVSKDKSGNPFLK